jgi:MerR family transcriptional regulator, light-induced transcriptional regulator
VVESDGVNLKQAASTLGVHYMTAYRYVRQGRLAARRGGSGWVIDPNDLAVLLATRSDPSNTSGQHPQGADWRARLRRTLVMGDEAAAWRVLEQALAAGHTPVDCYLDLLVGAIDDISSRSTLPDAPIAEEYLATATAARLVALLSARFRRPGRSRGTVVFGAPLGEHHTLAISVVADLVRLAGFSCLELGANVPPEAFAATAAGAYRLVAVGVGVSKATDLDLVRAIVDSVHEIDPRIPIVLGGQGATDPATAATTGADAWAADGREAVTVITELARTRRSVWLEAEQEASPDSVTTA